MVEVIISAKPLMGNFFFSDAFEAEFSKTGSLINRLDNRYLQSNEISYWSMNLKTNLNTAKLII